MTFLLSQPALQDDRLYYHSPLSKEKKIITLSLLSEYYLSRELKRITTPTAQSLALSSFTNLFLTQVKLSSRKNEKKKKHLQAVRLIFSLTYAFQKKKPQKLNL